MNNALSEYTVSLLHMNGTAGATTFTDTTGKTWTANGNARISITHSKFGGSSGYFDGVGDFLSAPDSDDWYLDNGSNTTSWTVDFWIRFWQLPASDIQGIIQQRVDNNNFWEINIGNGYVVFNIRTAGVTLVNKQNAFVPTIDTWHHVAVVKNGDAGYMMFIDGTQIGTTQTDTDSMSNYGGTIRIGTHTSSAGVDTNMTAYLDEFRISKGVARWTSNFTPPTSEY